jgi:hypothetical protein
VQAGGCWQQQTKRREHGAAGGSSLFSVEGHGSQLNWRPGRLPTGDTADCQSALPPLRTRAVAEWFVNSRRWFQPSLWDWWLAGLNLALKRRAMVGQPSGPGKGGGECQWLMSRQFPFHRKQRGTRRGETSRCASTTCQLRRAGVRFLG